MSLGTFTVSFFDFDLKEDSENDVLKCPNPVLLRLHNALVVRSQIKVVIVELFYWPRSKKRIGLGLIRFTTNMNVGRFTSNEERNYLNHV